MDINTNAVRVRPATEEPGLTNIQIMLRFDDTRDLWERWVAALDRWGQEINSAAATREDYYKHPDSAAYAHWRRSVDDDDDVGAADY